MSNFMNMGPEDNSIDLRVREKERVVRMGRASAIEEISYPEPTLKTGTSEFFESPAETLARLEKAEWSTAFINSLPNSSFAVVETGYAEGANKNARHLPFKDANGKVDVPHLRNALARCNQIKNVLGNDTDEELRSKAKKRLDKYAKKHLPSSEAAQEKS